MAEGGDNTTKLQESHVNRLFQNCSAHLKQFFGRRENKEDWEFEWQRDNWSKEYARPEIKRKVHEYWIEYRHLREIEQQVPLTDETRILDVGCGISTVLHYLPGTRIGIDPLADRYKQIFNYPDEIDIRGAYAESLPFDDGSFDVVFCSNCIDHTTDPQVAISEIYRVLRPAGYFILTCETFSENIGERNVAHPHSLNFDALQSLVREFAPVAHWQSPWYGLRKYALGHAPTEQVENIFLLQRPAATGA